MMKINYLNFIFGYIFNLFNEMKTNLNIITKGLILSAESIIKVLDGIMVVLIWIMLYVYLFALFALFASLVMCIIGFLIMSFIFMMKVYSMKNNVSKFTQSKYGKLLFKADWGNIHLVGIAKTIAIYFINLKYGQGCDPRILFICLTIFYVVLLVIYSNWFIEAIFNIQQGIFIIYEGLQNWNNSNYKNNINHNVDSNVVGKEDAIRFKNVIVRKIIERCAPQKKILIIQEKIT